MTSHEQKDEAAAADIIRELSMGTELIVSPGELFDRLSIAEIRVAKVADPEKKAIATFDVDHITEVIWGDMALHEKVELPFHTHFEFLRLTNRRLWEVEDQLRALDSKVFPIDMEKAEYDPDCKSAIVDFLTLSRRVYVLNTDRSEAKAAIDKACGVEPEVKQYNSFRR